MPTRSTISDVARMAGVSKVTVSYVLNGRGVEARISRDTQDRVIKAAQALSYSPNAVARSMASGQMDTLGVVFQHADYFADRSDFTMDLMHGVTMGALAARHNLMLHTKPVKDAQEEAAELMNGCVSGVLVLRNEDDPVLEILLRRKFPLVLFFSRIQDATVPYVDCDNVQGARLATMHLVEQGHRRIGMVSGTTHASSSLDRLNGFKSVLEENGLELREDDLLTIESGRELDAMRGYLDRPSLPTAVFSYSDLFAFNLIRAAGDMGLSVPDDLSVVGFDSVEACERSVPPLTSIRQPVREIAAASVEMLAKLVKGDPIGPNHVVFPTTLEVRGSTAPPRR